MKKNASKNPPPVSTPLNRNEGAVSDTDNDIPAELNYPPSEDITRQAKKEQLDVEYITRSGKYSDPSAIPENVIEPENVVDDEIKIVPGTEADVTKEDLRILESTDGMIPTSKLEDLDEEIADEGDLDIPGADLDDKNELVGEEDEENNYYSLGGENHENLEEDPS